MIGDLEEEKIQELGSVRRDLSSLILGDLSPQGMVMVSPEMNPTICSVFEAEIVLLFHATTFRRGFQVTVHVGNVRQTAVVEKIHAKVSWALVAPTFPGNGQFPLLPDLRELIPQSGQEPPPT